MTDFVTVVVGRTDGMVSSIGLDYDGVKFVSRGQGNTNLTWETANEKARVVAAVWGLLSLLRAAGIGIVGEDQLHSLGERKKS